METKEILEQAIVLWGIEAQFDMVVEECAELINAIQKNKRKRVDEADILEEAVDVFILLEQVRIWADAKDALDMKRGEIPPTYLNSWKDMYKRKMSRLEERIIKAQREQTKLMEVFK